MIVSEFASLLFEIQVNAHIIHLQTTSYAQHKALDVLYNEMTESLDAFIEAYQGQFGIIKGYSKQIPIKEGIDPVSYLKECCVKIEEFRSTIKEGYLQQLIDNIHELIYKILYQLTNLH